MIRLNKAIFDTEYSIMENSRLKLMIGIFDEEIAVRPMLNGLMVDKVLRSLWHRLTK